MYGILFLAMGSADSPVLVTFVMLGTVTNLVAAGVGFFGLAAGVTMWNVLSMSLRQAMIPAELLGRVLRAHRVALWGDIPLGALAGGALASHTSVSAVFLVSGLAQLVIVVLIRRLIDRHRRVIMDSFES